MKIALDERKLYSPQGFVSERKLELVFRCRKSVSRSRVQGIMSVKASAFAIPAKNPTELITTIIARAVDKKMNQLIMYKPFKRMELFIWLPSLSLDDSNEVPIIHKMLQENALG